MILEGGISKNYTQNWDKNGNIYYTDENGQVVDFKVNPFTKLANKAKATAINIGNWLNETNPNSEAYKQKVGTVLGLVTAPLGLGATLTGGIAKGLAPYVGRKIAQNMAQGIGSGVVGGAIGGGAEAGLNDRNIAIGGLQGATVGGLLGGLGGYGLGKVAQKFKRAKLPNNPQMHEQYFNDYIADLNNKTKAMADFRAGKLGMKNGKMQLAYDLAGDEVPLTETQAFKNWFGNSKVVDESGKPLTLSHGSVKTFDTFDKDLASPESDLGAGFYFTNSASDVNANYYGGGPDFDNKVVRLAERLANEEDIAYDIAEEKVRKELMGDPSKIDAYLKMENPLYIGKNETQLFDYDTYRQKAIDQYGLNPNDFDDIDAFEDEVQASIDNILYDEPYELTNNLYDILDSNDVEKVQGLITDTYYNGGGSFENLKSRLNDLYLENPETGDLVGNEVARRIVENLGYDGIIDSTVSKKFNMNLNPDTTHYVVFNPTQIKSVNNQGTFDPTNPNIYKSILAPIGAGALAERLLNKEYNERNSY